MCRCHAFPLLLLVAIWLASGLPAQAQSGKKIYLAPDDHTDFIWSASEADYYGYFQKMLSYHLDQIQATAKEPVGRQSKFTTDGTLWLKVFRDGSLKPDFDLSGKKDRFAELMLRHKEGNLTTPLTPLVCSWGGAPAEAVLRSMYFPGRLERQYDMRFRFAQALENQTIPFGLGSLWSGSGAKYAWHGVCACATVVKEDELRNRDREIYRWRGQDGSSMIMKWYTYFTNESIGGYAEARKPEKATELLLNEPRYQGYQVLGAFGQGWDDKLTLNSDIRDFVWKRKPDEHEVRVSNTIDFFEQFETQQAPLLQDFSAAFGNDWDIQPASIAEVSARVKRALIKLRAAEAMAAFVALENPKFKEDATTKRARELAFLNLGLYFEHDLTVTGFAQERLDWQKRLVDEIDRYVQALHVDAASALGALIKKSGNATRFFVFNPLGWERTDVANIPWTDNEPVHVIDLTTGEEVPSQFVPTSVKPTALRILASAVPSAGYKVFEVRPGKGLGTSTTLTHQDTTIANEHYRITLSGRGAITSMQPASGGGLEFVKESSPLKFNDLTTDPNSKSAAGNGTVSLEGGVGPVSVTLRAVRREIPAHTVKVTLYRGIPRVDIENTVTENFGNTPHYWAYHTAFAESPDTHHEEVGAILVAKLTSDAGHYSPVAARYDLLTMNSFVTMTGKIGNTSAGLTLSNTDGLFFRLGNSTPHNLDTMTPSFHPLLGGKFTGLDSQGHETRFLQRYALRAHTAYSPVSAMRFAQEHQNPFVVGAVTGGKVYPEDTASLLQVDNPNVLLWALKVHDDGIAKGLVARVWNLATRPQSYTLSTMASMKEARRITHIETDDATLTAPILKDGKMTATAHGYEMQTHRMVLGK